ncbi:hypothetical protein [Planomonospora sp. ID82291]|uniref:hypothetical protein n=1 Tax=Planomonospora sp. ID82291 TaxID=2738136 RepID=UPI0018C356A3|nr:hypothetical protein [Planomonospora sp. ID82291]MBG0818908.1 hypothetical protein [Planomonospora sp. ID82291]
MTSHTEPITLDPSARQELAELLDAWDAAIEGESGDAEIDAATELADAVRALIGR